MPSFINFNGDLIPSNTALLDICNRSFKYGDGLFESMRLMNGHLKFPDLHADRLQQGMRALKIENFSLFDDYFLKEKAEELAIMNKAKHGRLRLTVYRDAGGLYTPDFNKAGWCIELQPDQHNQYILNNRGIIMDVFTELVKPLNYLSNLKTCNSLIYVMAGLFKTQSRLDDVFILNQNGFLCEALSSNVFVLYQGHLYTPALSEGCIAGVMRQVVIKLALKHNIPVTEAQINPEILNQAEEVFLTNATRGIQWVIGSGIKRYFNKTSKLLMEELNKL
jgi:branched-chain amino acid aminotransferase